MPKQPLTLCIDFGGTSIKMMVVDLAGVQASEYVILPTPIPSTVTQVRKVLGDQIKILFKTSKFQRIAVGFPGVIQHGIIKTAPNMHSSWINLNLNSELSALTACPVRSANDADVQGYACVIGKGVELVITLGTGMGSALFLDGNLIPNLELAHHPFYRDQTYEYYLGISGLKRDGKDQWLQNLQFAIKLLAQTFNFDQLYLSGGNANLITCELPSLVKIVPNIGGVLGGIKLWEKY